MVIKQEQLFKKSGKNEPPIPEEVLRRLVLALHRTFFKPYEIKSGIVLMKKLSSNSIFQS